MTDTEDVGYEAIMAQARLRFVEASRTAVAALEELEPRLAEQPTAVEVITSLRREVHRMSGSAGTFGFRAVSRLCAAFETVVIDWASDDRADIERRSMIVRQFTIALDELFAAEDPTLPGAECQALSLVELPRPLLVRVVAEALARGFRPEWTTVDQFGDACDEESPAAVVAPRGIAAVESAHALARVLIDVAGAPPLEPLDGVGRVRVLAPGPTAREVLDTVEVLVARDGSGGTLIAVDDNPVVLALVRALAERERLQVITIDDPTRFIEVARSVEPSVLVVDVDMPHLDGITLVKQLREHPALRRTPVMMLTGHMSAETRREAFAAGADDFMMKPLVPMEFQRRVQALVAASRRDRARAGLHPGTGLALPAKTWQELEVSLATSGGAERCVVVMRPTRPPETPEALAAVQVESTRVARRLRGEGAVVGLIDDHTTAAVVPGAAAAVAARLADLSRSRAVDAPAWRAGVAPVALASANGSLHDLVDAAIAAADTARELGVPAHVWEPADGETAPDVILVEDDKALAELITFAMRQAGFTFRHFADGPSALEGLQRLRVREKPIVLLDLDLPGLDGHSVHEQLRVQRPGVFAFVFLSAHAGEAQQLRALQAGALDYVVKPVNLRVLMAKLATWRAQVQAA
ncbi:MAG: response regulator [Gemmatimonadetes bacterium]|nr:response regulator [Gemmatimonadota bacterium]